MNSDPDRELAIFIEALKVSCEERSPLLRRLCSSDQKLRSKVEALLRAHDRLGHFMEKPPSGEFID